MKLTQLNRMKQLLLVLTIAVTLCSCLKEQKCEYDDCAVVAPSAEIQAVQSYLSANSIVATQHCSGLFYKIENQGTGDRPTACSTVEVTYEGKLTNGTSFEKTTTPVSFGLGNLIRGWRNGIPLIKAGGKIKLYIPPSLAYGNYTGGSIPPNSILIFEIDLVAVH